MPDAAASRTDRSLSAIFEPASIAIIGASADPRKRGYQILRALREAGFRGLVYPVNPKGGFINGTTVYESTASLPSAPDLALISLPAPAVPAALSDVAAAGARAAVVLAVGFAESGDTGRALEDAVRGVARSTGLRVVGPNTSGLLNTATGLNLIGARGVRPGPLGLLMQSGNMTLSLMTEATRAGTGVSVCVGVGNETDLGFHEYLAAFAESSRTRALLVHAEGMRDPRAFLVAATAVSRTLPILLLKGGRSEAGARAALSHTGAMAGSHDYLSAGLAQAGVLEVRRSDELVSAGTALAWAAVHATRESHGDAGRPAILSDGGGQGTLAADLLTEMAVPLAAIDDSTRVTLRSRLGASAAVTNPVDLAGAADSDPLAFADALDVLCEAEEVDSCLVVGLFGGYALRFAEELAPAEVEAAGRMVATAERSGMPLVVHSLYAHVETESLSVLRTGGIPVIGSLEVACRALESVRRWRRLRLRGDGTDGFFGVRPVPPAGAAGASGPRVTLSEKAAMERLERAGVPVPRTIACRSAEEAARAAATLGGTLAVKVWSDAIVHKTEAGGVILDVEGPAEARRAFERVTERGRAHLAGRRGAPADSPSDTGEAGAAVLGALVAEQLPAPLCELIVGVRREPGLGPVLTVGSGGVRTELDRDLAHRVLPVTRDQLWRALEELRLAPVLRGHRGRPGVDRTALIEAIEGVARVLVEDPSVVEVEVNPLFGYPERCVAVDAVAAVEARGAVAESRAVPTQDAPADA